GSPGAARSRWCTAAPWWSWIPRQAGSGSSVAAVKSSAHRSNWRGGSASPSPPTARRARPGSGSMAWGSAASRTARSGSAAAAPRPASPSPRTGGCGHGEPPRLFRPRAPGGHHRPGGRRARRGGNRRPRGPDPPGSRRPGTGGRRRGAGHGLAPGGGCPRARRARRRPGPRPVVRPRCRRGDPHRHGRGVPGRDAHPSARPRGVARATAPPPEGPAMIGASLGELAVVLLITGLVAAALAGLLHGHERLARTSADHLARTETVRIAGAVIGAELRWLAPDRDIHAAAGDSVAIRALRAFAIACGGNGSATYARYRGLREPDPDKDSVVVLRPSGRETVF